MVHLVSAWEELGKTDPGLVSVIFEGDPTVGIHSTRDCLQCL